MAVKEVVVTSERFDLTKWDWKKWSENQLKFLKPLAIFVGMLYIGFLIPRIQENGISLEDFTPTNAVLTSIALYIANALYDLFSKWSDEKKYTVAK